METSALTKQFLAWAAERPRTYAEAMDAWRTTCPRLTIWEDAVSDGLVAIEQAGAMRAALIRVTDSGRRVLESAEA